MSRHLPRVWKGRRSHVQERDSQENLHPRKHRLISVEVEEAPQLWTTPLLVMGLLQPRAFLSSWSDLECPIQKGLWLQKEK